MNPQTLLGIGAMQGKVALGGQSSEQGQAAWTEGIQVWVRVQNGFSGVWMQ